MLFGALLAPVVSCGWMQGLLNKPTKSEKHDNVPRSLLVGRIASVSTHGNFVLIESYGSWLVSPGTVLFSEDEDHMTSLQVTGEKLGQYAAADIRSGVPMVGDAV